MTLNPVNQNFADDGLPGGTGGGADDLTTLLAAVFELQRMKWTLVAGNTAVTNIAIAGIALVDTIAFVMQIDIAVDTGTSATGNKVQDVIDRTSEAAITSAGNIQLSTTNTTGDKLLVVWFDKS